MSDVDRVRLAKPFPKEAVRKQQGFDYVPGHLYIHRLNDSAASWDFSVLGITYEPLADRNGQIVGRTATAHVRLCIPGMGCREHIGVQDLRHNSGADLQKGCITDGLKKASSLFGVGLELYGSDMEGDEPAPSNDQVTRPNAPQGVNTEPPSNAAVSTGFARPGPSEAQPEAPVKKSANGNGRRRHMMALMTERTMGDDDRHLIGWALFGKRSSTTWDADQVERVARWLGSHDRERWQTVLGFVRRMDQAASANDPAALQAVANDIGRAGLSDDELRACYRNYRDLMQPASAGQLAGMPAPTDRPGDDQYTR